MLRLPKWKQHFQTLRLKFPPNKKSFKKNVLAWVSATFLTNGWLKLFSVIIALMVWGFVASQNRGKYSEIVFTAPLLLKNIPSALQVSQTPESAVSLLVGLNRSIANSVNPNLFQVNVDLSEQKAGTFKYPLTTFSVSYDNDPIPKGMQVLQITPDNVSIQIEQLVSQEIEIKPRLVGNVKTGYAIHRVRIVPDTVSLTGPQSIMKTLKEVYTYPLKVEGITQDSSFTTSLDLPNGVRHAPSLEPLQALVSLTAEPARRLLLNVAVVFENSEGAAYKHSTSVLNVYVEGPPETVAALNKDTVFAVIDLNNYELGDYRGLTPPINLPDTVRVLEQWPIVDLFVIEKR